MVIEVLSPHTHESDLVTKRRLYAAYGVREYWIVDPEVERIEVLVLEGKALDKVAEFTEGEARSQAVLPEFAVALSRIFA
jgi:Uma2 family endonuclease